MPSMPVDAFGVHQELTGPKAAATLLGEMLLLVPHRFRVGTQPERQESRTTKKTKGYLAAADGRERSTANLWEEKSSPSALLLQGSQHSLHFWLKMKLALISLWQVDRKSS